MRHCLCICCAAVTWIIQSRIWPLHKKLNNNQVVPSTLWTLARRRPRPPRPSPHRPTRPPPAIFSLPVFSLPSTLFFNFTTFPALANHFNNISLSHFPRPLRRSSTVSCQFSWSLSSLIPASCLPVGNPDLTVNLASYLPPIPRARAF